MDSGGSVAAVDLCSYLFCFWPLYTGIVDVDFKLSGERADRRSCVSGTVQYFQFEPPSRLGYGGDRLYGQDVLYKKSLRLFIADNCFNIDDLDAAVGKPRRAHSVVINGMECALFTNMEQEGKTKVSSSTRGP
jgi:hypothetical protein